MFDKLRKEFEKAVQDQKNFEKRPHGVEESRARNSNTGAGLVLIGLILLGVNALLWVFAEKLLILPFILCIFCLLTGFFALKTGKLLGR